MKYAASYIIYFVGLTLFYIVISPIRAAFAAAEMIKPNS